MIKKNNLPRHIAIIMDGNGRWAKKRNLPRAEGHRRGIKVVENIVEAAAKAGIKVLSLYAFSTENWNR
ncbi:MAG: undecaprenyl diphosphate synthase family protein, partial [Candidatus Omnitrophica bacterium]|nr:undecaprenyl diphosphate synthase family protein [Candidatus Omnitrophota bacterium]